MSDYKASIKKWCDELTKTYQEVFLEIRKSMNTQELHSLETKLFQLKEDLTGNPTLTDWEAFERANELYQEFESKLILKNAADDFRADQQNGMVPIGGHKLPPLPYAYDALEPYIDEETMRLHHDKHHQSYVDGLNKAEKEMQKARGANNFDLIKHWEREAAFNGAGHYLHTIFWNIMSPDGGGEPTGEFMQMINQSFGSFNTFKNHFSEAANKVEGGGWAILVWSPRAHRLEILQAEKHQNLSQWDVVPLLVLDVWEHAYYLKYKNERKKYIDNWWNVVNWPEVEKRFNEARKLKWLPY